MRVLVTWGSKFGGTEGIARLVADELEQRGVEVVLAPAAGLRGVSGFDAAVIGGAIYATRWHKAALNFVSRNIRALRLIPVWLFSSGPLDPSADEDAIPPVKDVAALMARVGALGHATFGGRLAPDVKGFPAAAMAKTRAGDWRNPERVRAWAAQIAEALPAAKPGNGRELAGHSLWRLLAFGVAGWVVCALSMGLLMATLPVWLALTLHAIAAVVIFAALSIVYFRAPGARQPLPTALVFTAVVALLDAAIVAPFVEHSFAMFRSIAGLWLPFALVLLTTWASGAVMAMMPGKRL